MKRTLILFAAGGSLLASDPAAKDKSGYHLFKPTPREQMRPLATDNAFTVDAGHVQFDADLFNFSRDRHTPGRDSTHVNAWSFASINTRVGLSNSIEFALTTPLHNRVRTSAPGMGEVAEGFGDVTLRVKANLWGNDGGTTACAIMPSLKLPTASDGLGNGAVEGGFTAYFSATLPADWSFDARLELNAREHAAGGGHHAEWITVASFTRPLLERLWGYVELVGAYHAGENESHPAVSIGGGLQWALSDNVLLDGGVYFGVTRQATDINPFLTLSVRF